MTNRIFDLEIKDPRTALIVRMQAWAYSNVILRDMQMAEKVARDCLSGYDSIVKERPIDSHGYWSNHFFNVFKDTV
jgi:hypothetical protein